MSQPGMRVAASGLKPGRLLNILQCPGLLSTTKNYLGQNVKNVEVEKSCHRANIRVPMSVGNNQTILVPFSLDLGASCLQKVSRNTICPGSGGPWEEKPQSYGKLSLGSASPAGRRETLVWMPVQVTQSVSLGSFLNPAPLKGHITLPSTPSL